MTVNNWDMMMNTTQSSSQKVNFFEVMNLRSEWEGIVSYRKTYMLPSYSGNVDNLKWFLDHGKKNNKHRKNFDRATKIARTILQYCNEVERVS